MIVVEGGRENKSLIVWLLFIYLDDVSVSYIYSFFGVNDIKDLWICVRLSKWYLFIFTHDDKRRQRRRYKENPPIAHIFTTFFCLLLDYVFIQDILRDHRPKQATRKCVPPLTGYLLAHHHHHERVFSFLFPFPLFMCVSCCLHTILNNKTLSMLVS